MALPISSITALFLMWRHQFSVLVSMVFSLLSFIYSITLAPTMSFMTSKTPAADSSSPKLDPVVFFRHRFPHILDQIFDYTLPGPPPPDTFDGGCQERQRRGRILQKQVDHYSNSERFNKCAVSSEWLSYMVERFDRGRERALMLAWCMVITRPNTWDKAWQYGVHDGPRERAISNPIDELFSNKPFPYCYMSWNCPVCLCIVDRLQGTMFEGDILDMMRCMKEEKYEKYFYSFCRYKKCPKITAFLRYERIYTWDMLPWFTPRVRYMFQKL